MAYDRTYKIFHDALKADHETVYKEIKNKVSPAYDDLSKIEGLHDNFISVFDSTDRTTMRLKFICIILHLYSPATLYYNFSCQPGVREALKNVFNYKENAAISMIIKKAREKMKRKFFRDDVLTLIKLIS